MRSIDNLLSNLTDEEAYEIYYELERGLVPASGYARSFCQKVNRMIDKGELCINPTTYRKVYLPTLSKLLFKELARRYVSL